MICCVVSFWLDKIRPFWGVGRDHIASASEPITPASKHFTSVYTSVSFSCAGLRQQWWQSQERRCAMFTRISCWLLHMDRRTTFALIWDGVGAWVSCWRAWYDNGFCVIPSLATACDAATPVDVITTASIRGLALLAVALARTGCRLRLLSQETLPHSITHY